MAKGWMMFSGSDAAWDSLVQSLPGASVYQESAWRQIGTAIGKTIIRLAHDNDAGSPDACLQAHFRLLPGGGAYVFCRGGMVGAIEPCGESLIAFLRQEFHLRYVYLRCFSMRPRDPLAVTSFMAQGWQTCLCPINTGLSLVLLLGEGSKSLSESASGNWRHNLKRGLKRTPRVEYWETPAAAEILAIYKTMESFKNLRQQFENGELEMILKTMAKSLFVFRAFDDKDQVVAIRAYVRQGAKGFDFLAANSPAGREIYASHALFNAVVEHCRSSGVAHYDLAGIDPREGAGVYNFKRGTGAEHYEYLGEWDLASSPIIRLLMNLLMWWKINDPLASMISRILKPAQGHAY